MKKGWNAVVVVVLCCLTFAASGQEGLEKPCLSTEVEDWLSSQEHRPKSFESFADLPERYQRAVYGKLTEAERVELWQRHWQQASMLGKWNSEQAELLQEAQRLLTPDLFAALRNPDDLFHEATVDLVQSLKGRVARAFATRDRVELFGQIGLVSSFSTPSDAKSAASFGPGQPPIGPNSPCNCVFGQVCANAGTCQWVGCADAAYCGFIWFEPCNGQC